MPKWQYNNIINNRKGNMSSTQSSNPILARPEHYSASEAQAKFHKITLWRWEMSIERKWKEPIKEVEENPNKQLRKSINHLKNVEKK